MKHIIYSVLVVCSLFVFSACNTSEKKADMKKIETKEVVKGKEYTSKYICPMYCKGSGSSEMGICPVCKMDYELNEDYSGEGEDSDGHDHGDHEGHDHGDHEGHDH